MKKYRFGFLYSYFVLIWFMLTGLFNGIMLYFVGIKIKVVIDSLLALGLIFFNANTRRISYKQICFFSFYYFLTCISLLLHINNNHYGFQKLMNNVILTSISYLNLFILYKTFEKRYFTKGIKKLFKIQILLNIILFIFYLLFNKKTGIIGHSIIQIFIFQDFNGRFQGTFAEPGYLGFWLGASAFISLLVFERKQGFSLFILLLFILYTSCKAKFALIAIPIAILFSLFHFRIFFSKYNLNLILLFIIICLCSLFWLFVTEKFFYFLSQYISKDGSSTFVTRFSFLFTSFKDICLYPIGHGFGLNYEIFQPVLLDIIPIADKLGLETSELVGYMTDPNNMGSKETFSLISTSCGFFGIAIYFLYFKHLLCIKYYKNFIATSLILFCLIESVITGNIFYDPYFFLLLFIKMALNSNKCVEVKNE